jgi:tRNA A37 N6-isopentenylltransferase MiaA
MAQVRQRSRNFAKRQITWFRHLPGCRSSTKELTGKLWQSRMNK